MAGFPTAPGGESPKMVFSSRVLVTRNIGCRSSFEASWRFVQGTPQGITRTSRRATDKVTGPDGVDGHCLRRRVLRVCKGRKTGADLLGHGAQQISWPSIELNRSCGRRVGARVSRTLTPLVNARVPGSAMPIGQLGGCKIALWGDIHTPETLPLRSLPQPIGAGSSRPLSPLPSELMPREGQVPRLQGRKTLASLHGITTARTAAPGRETDGERRCHTRAASACGGRNRPNRP